ncbi:GGDEF domain-containing protein [bacterium]|nr:GGDEF domain-containing protein [bacterium]
MSAKARYLLEISLVKVVFMTLFWAATYSLQPVTELWFPYVQELVLFLFLAANATCIYFLCYREAPASPILRTLFALDVFFTLYLAVFLYASHGLLLLMLASLILFETLVVSRMLGFVALAYSIGLAFAVVRYTLPVVGLFSDAPGSLTLFYYALALVTTYGLAYFVVTRHRQLMNESEALAKELADSAVDSEISRQDIVKRNQQLSTLLQISESLSSSLEVDRLFRNFGVAIRNSVLFDNLSLLVYDPEVNSFRVLVTRDEFFDLSDARYFPIDKGVAGYVYNHGKSYIVDSADTDTMLAELPGFPRDIGSLICVPLYYQDDILGVLSLEAAEPGQFSSDDLAFVESISPLVAIAVNNVVSYQAIKTASTRDKLTNLHNYFSFTQRLYEFLEVSHRRKKPMTLLLIDIDDFKQVNDSHGHLAGNVVLTQIGELLISFFRRSDLVARYGGEEFTVVLNGTPADIGLVVADTLREMVMETEFLGGGKPKVSLTVSIGVSSTEDRNIEFIARPSRRHDDDHFVENLEEIAEKLIASADGAMYNSKRRGKNRVTASETSTIVHKNFTEYRSAAPEDALPKVAKRPLKKLFD